MNIGIIGYGKMGKIRHETLSKLYPYFKVAITDGDNSDEILADDNIDAIFICTPNKFNEPYTIKALENGKHVFCEKPPAFTAEGVERIIEAEKKSGKKLMYGFNHRSHGSVMKAKEIVDSGDFGKIIWMRGRYGKNVDAKLLDNWRMNKNESGGGILLDQGIHMLDLLLHFGGNYDVVQAIVSNLYWHLDIEDNVFCNLYNSERKIASSLHSTMTEWRYLFSLEIFLEKGYITINGLKTPSGSYGEEVLTTRKNLSKPPLVEWDSDIVTRFPVDNSWEIELKSFFDAIKNDTPITNGNSADALNLMKIVDKIYEYK
jgi:1,5-anhydro-D-fructose reductase (1,5-anhydro-D-mannitol-forming)